MKIPEGIVEVMRKQAKKTHGEGCRLVLSAVEPRRYPWRVFGLRYEVFRSGKTRAAEKVTF